MADSARLCVTNQLSDLKQILEEAKHRWLRVSEICEILRNHKKFRLTLQPPVKPSAGSVFLFDRKVLRYFRRDGHRWRKKKDGKTIKEAHEKLKAHGEDNENFQRRCYWMLDEQLQNIVLVRYREVKEGYKFGINRSKVTESEHQSLKIHSAPFLEQAHSETVSRASHASYPSEVDWNGQLLSSEFEGVSVPDPEIYSLVQLFQPEPSDPSFYSDGTTGTGLTGREQRSRSK